MDITFDPAKSARNLVVRGFTFDLVREFDWSEALIVEDTRMDYGERRLQALGFIESRLFVLVFTPRGSKVHVISLRKANPREVKHYASQTKS